MIIFFTIIIIIIYLLHTFSRKACSLPVRLLLGV